MKKGDYVLYRFSFQKIYGIYNSFSKTIHDNYDSINHRYANVILPNNVIVPIRDVESLTKEQNQMFQPLFRLKTEQWLSSREHKFISVEIEQLKSVHFFVEDGEIKEVETENHRITFLKTLSLEAQKKYFDIISINTSWITNY